MSSCNSIMKALNSHQAGFGSVSPEICMIIIINNFVNRFISVLLHDSFVSVHCWD